MPAPNRRTIHDINLTLLQYCFPLLPIITLQIRIGWMRSPAPAGGANISDWVTDITDGKEYQLMGCINVTS